MKIQDQEFSPASFRKEGVANIGDISFPYEVISQDNVLKDPGGTPKGSIFSYSYIRSDISPEESKKRPVLFAFNGGPGSSSLWLHWGLFGPKRVKVERVLEPPVVPPFELEDNPYSILDICDIVMIDPVGCGYGVLIDPDSAAEFFTAEKDAASVALFIRDWLIRYDRWESPKYLAGESYGTIRTCILAGTLMGGPTSGICQSLGISLNGIIAIGSLFLVDDSQSYYQEGSIEESVLLLPTLAATHYYHKPQPDISLEEFIEQAFTFAGDEYLRALFLGNRMNTEELDSCVKRLVHFTGLSAEYLRQKNLRVTAGEYPEAYCKETGKMVGLYDSRYSMEPLYGIKVPDPVADECAMGKYTPVYMGAMATAGKEMLGITFNRPYSIINFEVNGQWKYDFVRSPLQSLQAALRRNDKMRVLIANGIFDLMTSIGQARYSSAHLHASNSQVILREYPSGHMPYMGNESASQLSQDLRDLIR